MSATDELPAFVPSACQYMTADTATDPALAFRTCMLYVCAAQRSYGLTWAQQDRMGMTQAALATL